VTSKAIGIPLRRSPPPRSTGLGVGAQHRHVLMLATSSLDQTVRLWQLGHSDWAGAACALVNRNLSLAEWEQFAPDRPYERTCPDTPAGEGAPPVAQYELAPLIE
jgi:hypothetical protein